MKRRGFTLIELMVVIAVIAVLVAVSAPQVFKQIEKGRISAGESFYNSVKVAATSYFSDIALWPLSCTQVTCQTTAGANGGFILTATTNARWNGPYIDRWPGVNANPWSGNYQWANANGVNFYAAGPAVGERYIIITNVPTLQAQRLDIDKDGASTPAAGIVRNIGNAAWPAAGNTTVWMLVSRDGPVT